MSYLSLPNIAFSGQFQADTSTINNNTKFYKNETFKPEFQKQARIGKKGFIAENGYWNPEGTGAFRLIDAKVTQAQASVDDPGTSDPAVGLFVNAQDARTAAKLVDLDPQWQNASMIFGLRIILTDGKHEFMRGSYRPAPFRDIYFMRKAQDPAFGSETASAKFQSVLTDVEFTEHAKKSPILSALRASAEANGNKLSVNIMTGCFSKETTYGAMCGSIGPYLPGEPHSFVAGRRFGVETPTGSDTGGYIPNMCNYYRIGAFDAQISGNTFSADLSVALPQNQNDNQLLHMGDLSFAILKQADVVDETAKTATATLKTGQVIEASDFEQIGAIPYRDPNWLFKTSAQFHATLTDTQKTLAANLPLAIVQTKDGTHTIVAREMPAGLFARAEDFIFRMDPGTTVPAVECTRIRALQYGRSLPGAKISTVLQPETSADQSWAQPKGVTPPDYNVPTDKIAMNASRTTDAAGWADFAIVAKDPDNARGYIDGQIFVFGYGLPYKTGFDIPVFEYIAIHARNGVDVVEDPVWDTDIKPWMQKYDNLYPIMSKRLFSLSDPDVAREHAKILAFAFERPVHDPNHMPVTRDMSEGKRQLILNWLAKHTGVPAPDIMTAHPPLPDLSDAGAPSIPDAERSEAALTSMLESLPEEDAGKVASARMLAKGQLAALKGGTS